MHISLNDFTPLHWQHVRMIYRGPIAAHGPEGEGYDGIQASDDDDNRVYTDFVALGWITPHYRMRGDANNPLYRITPLGCAKITEYAEKMDMWDHMLTDRVTVVTASGQRFTNVKAAVDRETICFDNVEIPLNDGDIIERTLPSGQVEQYEVTDPGYNGDFGGIPAHYNARVQRRSRITPRTVAGQTTIYNLSGPNTRININSTDNSLNIVDADVTQLFADLKQTIRQRLSADAQKPLLDAVETMEGETGKAGFAAAYTGFMTHAANHVTVLSPFFPALSELLTGFTGG